jgi:hypothetical protein
MVAASPTPVPATYSSSSSLLLLQVGLGKTLVALAASRQTPAPVTHLGKRLIQEDGWSDDLLNGERQGRTGTHFP